LGGTDAHVINDRNAWHALGTVGSLGFVVAAGALLGWWVGSWADRRWGIEPWGLLTGLLLGLASAALECGRVLRRYIQAEASRDRARRP